MQTRTPLALEERAGPDPESVFDRALLLRILRRRWPVWAAAGPAAAALLFGALLATVPQSYTATTSLVLQQQVSGASGLLASVRGLGSSQKVYLGVLKSRALAAEAERLVPVRALYGLATAEAAAERIRQGVSVEEKDGLMYLRVTLPAPPLGRSLSGPAAPLLSGLGRRA
jgi:uncharacterized protein involved in exopolysaccharide biosynthesis